MARVRWEYREVIRTVVVETLEPGVVNRPQDVPPRSSSVVTRSPIGAAELARYAAPSVALAAIALTRGIAARRRRLAKRPDIALPRNHVPVIALPPGGFTVREGSGRSNGPSNGPDAG